MDIKNTYLMWIGSAHYSSIEDWVKEAAEQGVSKRLPNEHMGKSLLEPGTVVFVAHDEGEMDECDHCLGTISCGACRKREEAIAREQATIEKLTKAAEALEPGSKEAKSALRKAANATKRAAKLSVDMDNCEDCLGSGEVEAGSGGAVVFGDGDAWDYRRYTYYRNQPAKWTDADKGGISGMDRCEHCGGFGRIPCGKVFGLFVPEQVEFINPGTEEGNEKAKTLAESGIKEVSLAQVKGEKKRGCGKRHGGGVYATTTPGSASTSGAEAAKALGLDESDLEVKGNFVSFVAPVDISGTKRFRGLARWALPADVAEEAEMVAEAMED